MQSFLRYNDDLNVNLVKIDSKLFTNLEQARLYKNVRTSSTVLYNNFGSTVDAFYFISSSVFASKFCSVYRKTPSQTYFDYVCTLQGEITFTDYNIHNNDNYEYMVVVAIEDSLGGYTYQLYENRDEWNQKILTNIKWNSWSICNIEETDTTDNDNIYLKTGKTWLLGLNLEGEDLTQNMSITSWDTLGKYPKISIGQRNYEGSSMTCLLGQMAEVTKSTGAEEEETTYKVYEYTEKQNVNDVYARETEKLKAWKEFCNDGSLKLLKDIKGHSWIVQIADSTSNKINTQAITNPTTITFSWKEVLDISNISIITKE